LYITTSLQAITRREENKYGMGLNLMLMNTSHVERRERAI